MIKAILRGAAALAIPCLLWPVEAEASNEKPRPTSSQRELPHRKCMKFEIPEDAAMIYRDTYVILIDGLKTNFQEFVSANGQGHDGTARIADANLAGGSGRELRMNGLRLELEVPTGAKSVSVKFGATGGGLNLEVAGDLRHTADFRTLNRTQVGGARVNVAAQNTASPRGHRGTISISTALTHPTRLAIGGQELSIDDLCVYY
ncbi:MAG TPA: hypothetical protein VLL76_04675 [Candidatus Omnitrophota bacterium]|nr:hypothetical protein [Candidatus Omnitrophota bacterium]